MIFLGGRYFVSINNLVEVVQSFGDEMIRPIIARTYYVAHDFVRGVPFRDAFDLACQNLDRSREELSLNQYRLLLRLVNHAIESVPAYRSHIKKYLFPSAGGVAELLDALPLLDKSRLVLYKDEYLSRNKTGKSFLGSTSGSSGDSLVFRYDSSHMAWAQASKWRGRWWWGGRRGDSVGILWGRPLKQPSHAALLNGAKSWFRNEKHINTFQSLDEHCLSTIWDVFERKSPSFIYGYGSSLGALALYAKDNELMLTKHRQPKFVQYTADHMSVSEKAAAREVFGCPVVSDYGASEVAGIAAECSHGHLHISIDHCVVEVVSDEGSAVPMGEIGELVVTTLHNYSMPLIRYRIGDLGRLIDGVCECGNPLPRMELVAGKAVDLITTSFVKNVSAHYFDYVNINLMKRGFNGIAQFQVIQVARDEFVLKVIPGMERVDSAVEEFCRLASEKIGPVRWSILIVSVIDVESSGKRKYFVKNI